MIQSQKFKALIRITLLILLAVGSAEWSGAQVSVSGATCIVPGLPYQYNILANWSNTSTMRLCITGGTLSSGDTCTPSGSRPTFVIVTWRDSGVHKLDVVSSEGNLSVTMTATSNLDGGVVYEGDKVFVYDSAVASYRFRCTAPMGGSCTPVYKYQWQRSENGLNWVDISGAVQEELLFTGQVRVNTYFRRVTNEAGSQTIAYSDQALLAVQFN